MQASHCASIRMRLLLLLLTPGVGALLSAQAASIVETIAVGTSGQIERAFLLVHNGGSDAIGGAAAAHWARGCPNRPQRRRRHADGTNSHIEY